MGEGEEPNFGKSVVLLLDREPVLNSSWASRHVKINTQETSYGGKGKGCFIQEASSLGRC